jgi:acetolactate synthase I/II/III large subunit
VVTSGPGSTNALTAIASAYQDSVPLLVISGEANVQNIENRRKFQLRQGGPQDVDILRIAAPIVKCLQVAIMPIAVEGMFNLCIEQATTDRHGVSWFAVPLDVQNLEMPHD